ncbi:MAG: AAA family ATPase [Bacteroides sp. SM23_62_1]|nr:MAG: AAA family ATPase [Bacteroides sp. SM23_62_1]
MEEEARILVIDDDYDVLKTAHVFLKRFFTDIQIEQIPENIEEKIKSGNYDVVLLDMNFQRGKRTGEEGFIWLDRILSIDPQVVVIMITAYGDIDLAVRTIKAGATDFVLKPWKNQKLLATINAALQLKKSRKEVQHLRHTQQKLIEDMSQHYGLFIGESEPIKKCLGIVEKVAGTDADILILGENGTGKELIARMIHRKSGRHQRVFISVDLGSISENLFESELFGHMKGAYTDAHEDKPGRFELANEGTIFLDEIGNLSLPLQSKLLNILQNRKVIRVGSVNELPVDFRLICATNRPLNEMVQRNEFREDLLYRINMVELHVPSLRERKEDIPILFNHFFSLYKKKYNKATLKINSATITKLTHYHWPGNVRELQHVVERAVILSERNLVDFTDFMPRKTANQNTRNKEAVKLDEMEKLHIQKVIEQNRGNITRAAAELGISRTALHRRIRKHDI